MERTHNKIIPLFSNPLYLDTLKIEENNIEDSFKYTRINQKNNDGYLSEDKYVLNKLPDLKLAIEENIREYIYDILKINKSFNTQITTSWIIKHGLDDISELHYHENSMFSGVFYLKADTNSGSLVFQKPLNTGVFLPPLSPDVTEHNIFNCKSFIVSPTKGLLVLFPSHLEHYVTPNDSEKIRVCIAFNVVLKGNYGRNTLNEWSV